MRDPERGGQEKKKKVEREPEQQEGQAVNNVRSSPIASLSVTLYMYINVYMRLCMCDKFVK